MQEYVIDYVLIPLIKIGIVFGALSGVIAYLTLLERKVIAFMQVRLGPMRVGPHGLLQPIADGLKLMLKEDIVPERADRWIFALAPVITLIPAFIVFAVIPFGPTITILGKPVNLYVTDLNIGLLYVLSISSVGVLGIILGGWASNSKYPLLGALRSAAQMVSYEVALGFSIIGVLMLAGSLSLVKIVEAQKNAGFWYVFYQPVGFILFFICGVAETNRAPFDLPEAESELVAGFHTEYSGFRWSLFFMAEYAAMVILSAVAVTVYLGGWYAPFVYRLTEANGYHNLYVIVSLLVFLAKLGAILYLYFWLRWTLPRFRYDQLMDIGWKWLIPSALINITLTGIAVFLIQALDGWTIGGKQIKTIDSIGQGLNLTVTGKAVMIVFGLVGLVITGLLLSRINWRSRDFNLKSQRRGIRLVNVPKGKPAVAAN